MNSDRSSNAWFSLYVRWLVAAMVSCILLSIPIFAQAAPQPVRVAIVIANSDYSHAPFSPLPQTSAGADEIEHSLNKLQFEIVVREDQIRGKAGFRNVLSKVAQKLGNRRPDIVFIYYAGHGQVASERGDSYLLSVDFDPRRRHEEVASAISLSELIKSVDVWEPRAIVLAVDACHSLGTFHIDEAQKTAEVGTAPGMRGNASAGGDIPPVYISYAARPGDTTPDSTLYATALSTAMLRRGDDVKTVFHVVRQSIIDQTLDSPKPQVPVNDEELVGSAWFQAEFPEQIELRTSAIWPIPATIVNPKLLLNATGGIWIEPGGVVAEAPSFQLIGVDAEGHPHWQTDCKKLGVDPILQDSIAAHPDGRIFIGAHTWSRDRPWLPKLLVIDSQGSGIASFDLSKAATLVGSTYPAVQFGDETSDPLRPVKDLMSVPSLRFDGQGDAWLNIRSDDGVYNSIVRIGANLSDSEMLVSFSTDREVEHLYVNDILPLSQQDLERLDCLKHPRPCGPLVLATGRYVTDADTASAEAQLYEVSRGKARSARSLSKSSFIYDFSTIQMGQSGARDAGGGKDEPFFTLFGDVRKRRDQGLSNALIFVSAGNYAILATDSKSVTEFKPRGSSGCRAGKAVMLADGRLVALAQCLFDGQSKGAAILVSADLRVLGWTDVCGDSATCQNLDLRRTNDTSVEVAAKVGDTARIYKLEFSANPGMN